MREGGSELSIAIWLKREEWIFSKPSALAASSVVGESAIIVVPIVLEEEADVENCVGAKMVLKFESVDALGRETPCKTYS